MRSGIPASRHGEGGNRQRQADFSAGGLVSAISRVSPLLSDKPAIFSCIQAVGGLSEIPKLNVSMSGMEHISVLYGESGERLERLRVVRCRPVRASGSGCDGANGPALEKPPGRKPRGEPRWLSQAIPLWGFERLQPGLKRCSGSPKALFATRHAGLSADRPFYPVRCLVKTGVLAPKGKARRHRCSPVNCHRENRVGVVHEIPCSKGGARISCPRPKVSMMTMAAPQSGQTNVG